MFRQICALGLIILLVSLPADSSALSIAPDPLVRVVADGYVLGFDEGPLIVDDRVVVSWRNLALFYGFALDYAAESQRVTIQRADRTVVLTVGSAEALVNGAAVTVDVVPFVKEGRVLIPLRLAAEGLGLTVSWEEASRTVFLYGGKQQPSPIPMLTPGEIESAYFSLPTSLDSRYVSQVVTPATPEGAALIDLVAAGWQKAVPGLFVTELAAQGYQIPGLAPSGIRLELTDGFASAALVPARRGNTAGFSAKGFLRLWISRSGVEESAFVYAPELAALIDRSHWPPPPE